MVRLHQKDVFLLILSTMIGILIWVLSPSFTGEAEPWDSANGYYPLSLLLSGILIGFLGKGKPWLWPIGIYLGQLLYCTVKAIFFSRGTGVNFFFPIGMIFMLKYCIIAFIGSLVGTGIGKCLAKSRKGKDAFQD
jgi:hypothetical protein